MQSINLIQELKRRCCFGLFLTAIPVAMSAGAECAPLGDPAAVLAGTGWGQASNNDPIPHNRKSSLRSILKEIEKTYKIRFAINDKLVDKKFVDVQKVIFRDLDNTLRDLLNPFNLTYKLINGYYVIQTQPVPVAGDREDHSETGISLNGDSADSFRGRGAPGENKRSTADITVTGKVVNEADAHPLPGVVVTLKGNEQVVAVSDINGKFSLKVPDKDAILLFSHIGFKQQEVPILGRSTLEVTLEKDVQSLQEVVINIPYGKQTKAAFTGAAVTIDGKELADRPRSSFQQSLQGTVPGLQVMEATGQPGAAPSVRIRGISSFGGINTPLYVVDGVPMLTQSVTTLAFSSNSGAGINPNDIESVTILKDASATSIYGSQGANGVILITTKSGKSGRSKVNIAANYGVNAMATSKRNKPLSTAEMSELLIEGVINNKTNSATANINTPEEAYQFLISQGLNPDVNTDWFDVITQQGHYSQYTASVSGGNDKSNFYLSGGYYKQDAVTKGQNFERKTFRSTINHKVSDKFKVSARLGATAQQLSTISGAGAGLNPVRSLYRLVPWLPPYLENGDYNPSITYNPEMARLENIYETNIYQLIGNVSAEYNFTDQLSYESRAAIDFHYSDDFRYWSPRWPDGVGAKGRGAEYSTVWNNWTINNLLKYRRQFGDVAMNATLGQEAGKRNLKRVSTQADNYAAEDLYTLANASTPYVAWSSKQHSSIVSYFLNTSFDYKRKYYLNATVRRDGSSRFGADYRYGNFWSVGAAWNIHEEDFFMPLFSSVLDQLKLRASYGVSGSQMGEYYGAQGFYSTGQNYLDQPGIAIGQLESASLMWEQNWPLDIGVEFSLFNSRLTGTVDWYTRTTKKLYQDMPISYTNARPSINFNVGSMKNYGLEISLNGQIVRPSGSSGNGFGWNASFNISTLNNKILAFQDSSVVQSYFQREIGGNYYQFFLRGYAGVERETGQALWFTDGTRKNTTLTYNSARPFKQNDKTALAKFFGGLTNTFSYGNFSLSTLIYFNWGNYIYDVWGQYTQSDGSGGLGEAATMGRMLYENRWKEPGDPAKYPKIVYRGTQSGIVGQHSTRFLYDGSYIRLRDVTLAYDLPIRKQTKPIFSAASISLKASNLFTYIHDKLLPYDPEVGTDGLLDQNLPISKQYAVGINLTF